MTSRLLACFLLTACGDLSPTMTDAALAERRANIRALVEKQLTSVDHAFLGREELIIRDERLLAPFLDRIMSNLESWIDGDEARLRSFLESQVNGARDELITCDDGIKALNSLAQTAFAKPKIERHEGKTPGRKASELEKQAAKVAGTILSGRPAVARDLPAVQWVEVYADFGLIPVPLEKNPRNKQSGSLLRHRQDAAKDWLDDQHPVRPRLEVIARLARDLMRQHPDAKRLVLQMIVLRTSGEPVKWEFSIEPSANKEFNLSGTATAPGFHDDFDSHLLTP